MKLNENRSKVSGHMEGTRIEGKLRDIDCVLVAWSCALQIFG